MEDTYIDDTFQTIGKDRKINTWHAFNPEQTQWIKDTYIKTCPFCGEAATVFFHDPGAPFPGGYVGVSCYQEDCPLDDVSIDIKCRTEDISETLKEVVKRWNTRK